jgi:hypothetical protein
MLAHAWNSISPGMFSPYHFSCLYDWYYSRKPPHICLQQFQRHQAKKSALRGRKGGGRFCCVSHLQCWFYSTRGFFYGCGFLLSGVWPRNVFALCFLHSFRRFHLTYIPICCEEVFYAVSNILGTFYYVAPATASFTVFIRVCIHSSEFVSIPVRLYCISCRSSTQSIVL